MDIDVTITTWEHALTCDSGRAATTVQQYVRDVRRFALWLQSYAPGSSIADLTPGDVRAYRDTVLSSGRAPSTINRALVSLTLFCDHAGRQGDNPVRRVNPVNEVAQAPQALTRLEWNAVHRAAEQRVRRDHGLALALVCLMRYAGPRVGEVAALQVSDVVISARRGTLIIRRGKGVTHREVPLIAEAREPLQIYRETRQQLAERWAQRLRVHGQPVPTWATWPDGHLFLSQRGPLTDRGIRVIVAQLGQTAKLEHPLSPHQLRHTFATALLDPSAYGITRPPATLPAVQALLGHADIATTAGYTRASAADLARMLGEPSEFC
jgi:site-specific recombinase XerD